MRKYVFLHNYNILVKRLPSWDESAMKIATLIPIIQWVPLTYAYGQCGPSIGTVKDMLDKYVEGAIVLPKRPPTIKVQIGDVTIDSEHTASKKGHVLSFVRSREVAEAYVAGTLYDDHPYPTGRSYVLSVKGKVVLREVALEYGDQVRRISIIKNDPTKEDLVDYLYASAIFTNYLLNDGGFSISYRILPDSGTAPFYDTCWMSYGITEPYIAPFEMHSIGHGYNKQSYGKDWAQLTPAAIRKAYKVPHEG